MIIDMRKRDVPPGYGGHVPCRNEVYGVCEGKALKLAVATYELFQTIKKPPRYGALINTPETPYMATNKNLKYTRNTNSMTALDKTRNSENDLLNLQLPRLQQERVI